MIPFVGLSWVIVVFSLLVCFFLSLDSLILGVFGWFEELDGFLFIFFLFFLEFTRFVYFNKTFCLLKIIAQSLAFNYIYILVFFCTSENIHSFLVHNYNYNYNSK